MSTEVTWSRDATSLRIGAASQPVLGASGDSRRISWGWQHLSAPGAAATTMANMTDVLTAFARGAVLPPDSTMMPRATSNGYPVLAAVWDLTPAAPTALAVIAYDEVASIK